MFHHIWFFSMSRKSFLSTIWHCNLTAPWPTVCHCWGDSLNKPMLTTAYYSCLTWRSLGVLYNKVRSQTLVKHLVYGPLDYSPLAFYVHSSFLGCFFCVPKFFFNLFLQFLPPGWLIFKWFYFSRCACLYVKYS